jgi:hypothetical protein
MNNKFTKEEKMTPIYTTPLRHQSSNSPATDKEQQFLQNNTSLAENPMPMHRHRAYYGEIGDVICYTSGCLSVSKGDGYCVKHCAKETGCMTCPK